MSTFGAAYGNTPGSSDEPPRPPVVIENIVASQHFYDTLSQQQVMDVARAIIASHWGAISQFLNGQRQMGMVLPASYKQVNFGDLNAQYQRLGNQERLILDVYPETSPLNPGTLQTDLNFDGYLIWTHCQPEGWHGDGINSRSVIVGPFDVFFNGYLVAQEYQPTLPYGGFALLFGETGLRAQSNIDIPAPGLNQLNLSNPTDTAKPVMPPPGWGSIPAGQAPDGTGQDEIARELGYWVFDWENPQNWGKYLLGQGQPQNWDNLTTRNGTLGAPFKLALDKGIQFADSTKSILNYKTSNTFAILKSPASLDSEVVVAGVIVAEFYDRKKMRSVSASWKYPLIPNQQVNVTDYPVAYGSWYYSGGFFQNAGVSFDLTPGNQTPDGHDDHVFQVGDHDGVYFSPFGDPGFTPKDAAAYDDWLNQCTQAISQFGQQQTAALKTVDDALTAMDDDYTRAYKEAIFLRGMKGDPTLYQNYFGDLHTLYWDNLDDHVITLQKPDLSIYDQPIAIKNVETFIVGVSDTNVVTYGPTQQESLVLTDALTTWERNVTQVGIFIRNRYYNNGDTQTVEGAGTPVIVTTTVSDIEENPPLVGTEGKQFWGPTTIVKIMDDCLTDMTATMTHRQQLLDERDDILNEKVTLPPRPTLGADYRIFKYRPLTINGDVWSYPDDYLGGT